MKLFDFILCLLFIELAGIIIHTHLSIVCSTVKYLTREEKINDAREFEKKIREKQSECWKV